MGSKLMGFAHVDLVFIGVFWISLLFLVVFNDLERLLTAESIWLPIYR